MIEILPNKKRKPCFIVSINYMIGDANGNTTETLIVNREQLEKLESYLKILTKLKPLKGHWGICFSNYPSEYPGEYIGLNEEEYSMFLDLLDSDKTPCEELTDLLYTERESYWVSFTELNIEYIDENNVIYDVMLL